MLPTLAETLPTLAEMLLTFAEMLWTLAETFAEHPDRLPNAGNGPQTNGSVPQSPQTHSQ